MQVELSIIIVSYNVSKLVVKCIHSIYQYEKDIPFEILLVDNNSCDDTISIVKSEFNKCDNIEQA